MIFLSRIDYLPACKLVNGDEGEESELEEDAELHVFSIVSSGSNLI